MNRAQKSKTRLSLAYLHSHKYELIQYITSWYGEGWVSKILKSAPSTKSWKSGQNSSSLKKTPCKIFLVDVGNWCFVPKSSYKYEEARPIKMEAWFGGSRLLGLYFNLFVEKINDDSILWVYSLSLILN